jgi:hypothetical protein
MFAMPPVVMAPPVGAPFMPPLVVLSEVPELLLEQANMESDPNKLNVLNVLNRMITLSIVEQTGWHPGQRLAATFKARCLERRHKALDRRAYGSGYGVLRG